MIELGPAQAATKVQATFTALPTQIFSAAPTFSLTGNT